MAVNENGAPPTHRRGGEARSRRVVIVGAGIAGLAAALRLYRAGWNPLVIERAPARRSSGYMLNMTGAGYDAVEHFGLLPSLRDRDLGFFASTLVRADGRPKFTIPPKIAEAALGDRALTVFRGDLESALYAAVRDNCEIRFGTTVLRVAEGADGVDVECDDTTTTRADLLIGADGLHSSVRALVFGPESDFRTDFHHLVGAFSLTHVDDEVPRDSSTTFIGAGRTASVINLGPARSSAFFTYRTDDPDAELARGPALALSDAFDDLGGGIPKALHTLRADPADTYFDSVSQIVMDRWSHGRVMLLGDAAWSATVFAGYGATLALTGADRLGTVLEASDTDVPAALRWWESELRPEIRKRQAIARKGMHQFAPPTRVHAWVRNLMTRAIVAPGVRGFVQRGIQRTNR